MQYFTPDHELFRQSVRQFIEKEVVPYAEIWEREQRIPKEIWVKMGDLGFMGLGYEEKYGGTKVDFFYSVIFLEEISRATMAGFAAAVSVHVYVSVAHIAKIGSDYLKEHYLAPAIAGKKLGALAITEPGGGSDVASIQTIAIKQGENYVLNGSKTFITNGVYADFIVVACRTAEGKGVEGMSLLVVDREMLGVSANKLKKIGWHCSDTAEIFFDNVVVPQKNLVGKEGQGFYYMMDSFQLERLACGITALAGAYHAIEYTIRYIHERQAFGKKIKQFQTIRHTIANLLTEWEAAKCLVYQTAWRHGQGEYVVKEASMVKLLTTELGKKIADECLQFFGGYGYMEDFLIARMYRDARVGTIVAGTSEIMREIIAKIALDEVKYKSSYESHGAIKPNPTAADIIFSIPQRFRPEKATDYETCIHFQISGENGGDFSVNITNGVCTLEKGLLGVPSCLIAVLDTDYVAIELGQMDVQAAFMAGKIHVTQPMEMLRFSKCFTRIASP